MRGGQCHAMLPGVVAQGAASLVAAQLDVVSGDLDLLLAQVFGEDAADLAIADQADIPLFGIARWGSHGGRFSLGAIFWDDFIAWEYSPSRSQPATSRYRTSTGRRYLPAHLP